MAFSPLLAVVTDSAAKSATGTWYWQLGVPIVALFLSVMFGYWLAKAVRLADMGWRFAIVFFTITASVLITAFGWPPKLGIDLKGGIILVYECADDLATVSDPNSDAPTKAENASKISIQDVVEGISKRLNPSGVSDVVVRALGTQQIEIIVPEIANEQIADIKRQVQTAGFLQFRIIANNRKHDDIIRLAQGTIDDFSPAGHRVRDVAGKLLGEWIEVRNDRIGDALRGGDFTRLNPQTNMTEVLVVIDPYHVEGKDVFSAQPDIDRNGGWAVAFSMRSEGAEKFGRLTSDNLPDKQTGAEYRLGIMVDRQLISAPSIKSQINSDGQITGGFDRKEVSFLANIIKSGRLPAALKPNPISETSIDPLLGADTIRKSSISFAVSTAAVFLFMLVYYNFSGFVACIAMLLNILFTLAIMIAFKASITMPGMAGFVLTVGMSVDANVLIYERFRDEMAHGTGMRTAIRNGFSRATTTIVDSQLTTLITAVVLYAIGTDQIKGFAITLILGIITSLFTAIFCSRILFDLADRKRWITSLSMRQMFGQTNFDFMAMRNKWIALSSILILAGFVGMFLRGDSIYDIDLRGGTSVNLMLREPESIEKVRAKITNELKDKLRYDVAVAKLAMGGRPAETVYKVDTSITDRVELEKKLTELFQGNLVTRSATYSEPTSISTRVAPNKSVSPATTKSEPKSSEPMKPKQDASPSAQEKPSTTETKGASADPASKPEDKVDPREAKPMPPEAPAKGDSSRSRLPVESQLAFAGDNQLALALLADPEPDQKQADSSKTTSGAEKNAESTADSKADSNVKPAANTPSEPKSAAVAPAVDEQKNIAAPTSPKNAPAPGPSDGPIGPNFTTESTITFQDMTDAGTLNQFILDAQAKSPSSQNVDFRIPDWDGRGSEKKQSWVVQFSADAPAVKSLLVGIQSEINGKPHWLSSSEVKGLVVERMKEAAIWATIISFVGIALYVWFRFEKLSYGIAAIVALIHDVLVTLGLIALSKWFAGFLGFALVEEFKINLTVVAAVLTLVGYSINDTIVVFDYIREVKGRRPLLSPDIINLSINNTLARSVITSGLTFLTVLLLYAMGGEPIHAFAFALVVGIIAGSYSSIFIAAPILLWLEPSEKSPQVGSVKSGQSTKTTV